MAQVGIPINGNTYDASLASRWLYGRTNGVFSSNTDLLVTPATGMTVDVSTGAAWMAPSQFVNCCYTNDAVETLTFALAGGLLPRIDRIVVRWDVTDIATHPYLLVKTGTYAASPTAPEVERTATGWELAIADVRIAAGTLQITQSMITDKRLDESVCGIVSSGIDAIPTQSLHDSFMAWWTEFQGDLETKASVFEAWITDFQTGNTTNFNTWLANFQSTASSNWNSWYSTNTTNFADQFNSWFADLQDVLDENQATNLYNKIDAHEQLTMVTGEPHGTRLNNGRFQVNDGVGWITLATFQQGYTAGYGDSLLRTAMAFDLLQLTAAQFDALIERDIESLIPTFASGNWGFVQASTDGSYSVSDGIITVTGTNISNYKQLRVYSNATAPTLGNIAANTTYRLTTDVYITSAGDGAVVVNLRKFATSTTNPIALTADSNITGRWQTLTRTITFTDSDISDASYWGVIITSYTGDSVQFRNARLTVA